MPTHFRDAWIVWRRGKMPATYRMIRLSEDAAGESHFDEVEVEQSLSQFAPPARPFLVSPTEKASGYATIRIPVGWIGERHPSPHRQMCFLLVRGIQSNRQRWRCSSDRTGHGLAHDGHAGKGA